MRAPSVWAEQGFFVVGTDSLEIVLRAGERGHLELVWCGEPIAGDPTTLHELLPRWPDVPGMVISHGRMRDSSVSLERQPLAFSSRGKGDDRQPAVALRDHLVGDFTYLSQRLVPGAPGPSGLPGARPDPGSETLEITLVDAHLGLECVLHWSTFPDSGVIARRSTLVNRSAEPLVVSHLASALFDLPDLDFDVMTFDGWSTSEAHLTRRSLGPHLVTSASATGASSSHHNPGLLLVEPHATESAGRCYGFNLVYSGNHATTVQAGRWGTTRLVTGINPDGFAWELAPGDSLESPQAVVAHSTTGLAALSRRFHHFVSGNIVPEPWRHRERPVVFNHWEGTYFDYTTRTLLEMAREAKEFGAEVFVLDDGWFAGRNDPHGGLGDWQVDETKLPGGLDELSRGLSDLGLELGIWFEPESVSPASTLYREHPEWAIHDGDREPSEGRHQLLLDLTLPQVRDHIVEAVTSVLDSAAISYVKWDMNRLISDAGEPGFHHRYMLGLYEVLERIFGPRPEVLLEACASGGSRFDLGMLRFAPQIWASDCTDPHERLSIQHGLSHLYPRSTISAHVSQSPNHQTGRATSLFFRFAVAAPYTFGVELDPATLSPAERRELAHLVSWYKTHRPTLQFGSHHRVDRVDGTPLQLVVGDGADRLAFGYGTGMRPGRGHGLLTVPDPIDGATRLTDPFSHATSVVPGGALARGIARLPIAEGDAGVTIVAGEPAGSAPGFPSRDGAREP